MADLSTVTLPSGDTYNLMDQNAVPSSEKATANGVATLDANGLIPQSQMPGMVILSYGNNTWDDFLAAYQKNNVIYCRASSNSNPASGSQTRLAFMAYVNNATSPTEVEFQYYRSVSSHNITQQGDQVYVYKLNKSSGWSVTVREAYTRITTSTGLTSSWSGGVLTEKAALVSETKLTNAATAATEVAGRVYPVAVDTNGKLAVNVPWESGPSVVQMNQDNANTVPSSKVVYDATSATMDALTTLSDPPNDGFTLLVSNTTLVGGFCSKVGKIVVFNVVFTVTGSTQITSGTNIVEFQYHNAARCDFLLLSLSGDVITDLYLAAGSKRGAVNGIALSAGGRTYSVSGAFYTND